MAEFVAFDANVEVNGKTILSFVEGMGAFKKVALKILENNGIKEPEKNKWYLQQNWLNAFKEISKKIGDATIKIIGSKIPESADWPPHIKKVSDALASIDIAYHLNHRKNNELLFNPETGEMQEGIGHYGYKKIDDNSIIMKCNNPYPCKFDLGIIEAVAEKFKDTDSRILIQHEAGACRKNGHEYCEYSVKWT